MANVRIFAYGGVVQIEERLLKYSNTSSVFVRMEPYLWSQKLTLSGTSSPVASSVQPNDTAAMVVIEVDDGTFVRYEFNMNGPNVNARQAGTLSPRLAGENVFPWAGGATISVVDASQV